MYKSKTGWTSTYNGTDDFGFTALPAGYRDNSNKYKYVSELIEFQTSTEDNLNGPCIAEISGKEKPYGGLCSNSNAAELRSVRCIKDYKVADYLNSGVTYGEFTDKRDNQVYKTVEIGDQTWMAQNLNYKYQEGANSYCYGNDSLMCNFLGRLYLWSAAKEACPENWRLPTKADFEKLLNYVGVGGNKDYPIAVAKLKTTHGWDRNGNGTNDYGFSALPAGYVSPTDLETIGAGSFSDFWSITEKNEDDAYLLSMDYEANSGSIIPQTKQYGFSVRCIQGLPSTKKPTDFLNSNKTYGEFTDSRDNQVYKTIKIGHQEWMAQNLNYETTSSACYDDKDYNCNTYGRLYKWTDAQNVCPEGWHLPKWEEYQTLVDAVGGKETAGKKLKAANDWVEDYNTGDNESGFTILPAGYKETHEYKWLNFGAFFQTSSVNDVNGPCYAEIFENGNFESGLCSKTDEMRSVRCVKDYKSWDFLNPNIEYGEFTDSRDDRVYKTVEIGNQTWMAENLNYKTENSYCYDDNTANCNAYGRLYTWEDAQNACPTGWKLPDYADGRALLEYITGEPYDGITTISKKLKSSTSWCFGCNGSDDYGFSALPTYGYAGNFAHFITSEKVGCKISDDETISTCGGIITIYDNEYAVLGNMGDIANTNEAYSIRCIKE